MKLVFLVVVAALILQAPTGGQNPSLTPNSKYRGLATDGSDLGPHVDFKQIEACAVHALDSPECKGTNTEPIAVRPPANLRVLAP